MEEARYGADSPGTFLEIAHDSRQVPTLEGQKRLSFSFRVIYHHHKEERKRHETDGLSTMVYRVVLSLQRPVAGCGEGGHHEGKQGARRMSELIARQGRWLCTFGSSVPCRLRMAIAG